tara:strand:+ start:958 stop:1374 length:417 start_codon:yes stop_codon:yes gene_type:complete
MIQKEKILARFEKVYASTSDNSQYQCLCPNHDDKTASLGIKFDGDKVVINCFGGCETGDVIKAAGLSWSDIMPDSLDNDYKPNKRFNPFAVVKAMSGDALFMYLCANEIIKNKPLQKSDQQKLLSLRVKWKGIYDDIR